MKYFINTLREGDHIGEVYLCKKKQRSVAKNGKAYESVILQDKTGLLDAKIWEPNSNAIEDFDVLDHVYVVGEVTSYQGAPQLKILRSRRVQEGEYDPLDYLPISDKDIDEMYAQLLSYVDDLREPGLKKLAEYFYRNEKFEKQFKGHSAAKAVHHGFVGGLLEHTLAVTQCCDFFCRQYPLLNRDLLLTAAMLHDIGKLDELSEFPENDYTDEGQLLGHIVIGADWISRVIDRIGDFPKSRKNELLHCIVAHHGKLEFGSPKAPALAEALALSFADNVDAKMETFKEAFEAVPENDLEWQGYHRFLETNIRRTMQPEP